MGQKLTTPRASDPQPDNEHRDADGNSQVPPVWETKPETESETPGEERLEDEEWARHGPDATPTEE